MEPALDAVLQTLQRDDGPQLLQSLLIALSKSRIVREMVSPQDFNTEIGAICAADPVIRQSFMVLICGPSPHTSAENVEGRLHIRDGGLEDRLWNLLEPYALLKDSGNQGPNVLAIARAQTLLSQTSPVITSARSRGRKTTNHHREV